MKLDPQNAFIAATGSITATAGTLTLLQTIQAVVGITAATVGIAASGCAIYWGWRRHCNEMRKPSTTTEAK